jgi:hypothetical protein
MKQRQFSIALIMPIVAIIAADCALLTVDLGGSLIMLPSLVILQVGLVLMLSKRGCSRLFWIGFELSGWLMTIVAYLNSRALERGYGRSLAWVFTFLNRQTPRLSQMMGRVLSDEVINILVESLALALPLLFFAWVGGCLIMNIPCNDNNSDPAPTAPNRVEPTI